MKKLTIFILAIAALASCTNKSAEIALQSKNDSLERIINEKDSAIYTVLGTFNEIENNLATIKAKENIISATVSDIEDQRSREEKINEDINLIYELMQDNQEKVNKLQEQLKRAHIKNNDLQNTIKNLQAKLAEKNAEIIELRKNLLDMNLKIDELTYTLDTLAFDNKVKQAIINAQDESLNTAYYLFGTEKELKEMQVLDKKGSFIGKAKHLNEDFNKEYFTEIDIRNQLKFEFDNAKKIRIITSHPSSSFELYGEKPVDSLVINDHDEFWSVSKYLLIVIE